jgi:D-xylose transport system substrate-binding protein
MRKLSIIASSLMILALLAACGGAATQVPTLPAITEPTATQPSTAQPEAPTQMATPMATEMATEAPTESASQGPTVEVAMNTNLNEDILVNDMGFTLYTFKNDSPGQSACEGTCAQNWPPLTVPTGVTPTEGSGITGTLGTFTRSDGSIQVTYDDQPLYTYAKDSNAGDDNGQGFNSVWYVVPTSQPSSSGSSSMSGTIALLLPETKTTRYETADRPDFEAKFKELCPDCQIIYSNANQDANTQLSQAEAALANGAQVLVLDPVDSGAASVIADKAKAQGVPVIAYDRLVLNSDGVNYYISFDNMKVGELQAQSLVDELTAMGVQDPQIVMINGSPTDNNASQFKAGAHNVFDPLVNDGKLTIAKEYDTPDWSPDQAQTEMQQALTALGDKVDGVYCANDGTASGAIAAMKAANLSPFPPVTGQDAELAAIQRILTGDQYMTVYKAIKPEAEAAANLAYDLLTQTTVPADMTNGVTVNNGSIDVPSVLLTPVAVTKDNIQSTVVQDGFWTVEQICTTEYADACKAAGLQ